MKIETWNWSRFEGVAKTFASDYPLAETVLRLREDAEAGSGWGAFADRLEVETTGERVRIARRKVEFGRRQWTEFAGVFRQGEKGVTLEGEFRLTMSTKLSITFVNRQTFREDVAWMSRTISQRLTEPERWVAPKAEADPGELRNGGAWWYEGFRQFWTWYYQRVRRWNR